MAENEDDGILETEKVDDKEGAESEGGGSFLDKIKRMLNFSTSRSKDKKGSESEGSESEGDEAGGGSFLDKIKSKLNLSTSLLIKIAIGLAVLIIAVGGYLFFTSGDEPVDNELSSDVIEQDAAEATTDEVISEEDITIPDLAPLPDASTAISSDENDIMLPATPEMPDVSGAVSALPPEKPEDMALELFQLREQALLLAEENRRLKQRINNVENQRAPNELRPASSTTREAEQESAPKPTWGDFAPIYRGQ